MNQFAVLAAAHIGILACPLISCQEYVDGVMSMENAVMINTDQMMAAAKGCADRHDCPRYHGNACGESSCSGCSSVSSDQETYRTAVFRGRLLLPHSDLGGYKEYVVSIVTEHSS